MYGEPDGKWSLPLTTPCNTKRATGALPYIENTAAGRPFHRSKACGNKFLRNHTVVECHVYKWCGWYLSSWHTACLEYSAAGNRSNSFPEHSMMKAIENAQRGDIFTQSQCVKPFTDHWLGREKLYINILRNISKIGRKIRTEYLNSTFLLSTLLYGSKCRKKIVSRFLKYYVQVSDLCIFSFIIDTLYM